ncbi:MAG: hypothetical protein EOP59_00785 [Sphingomonadales bacterium]|nr:MAG: hypothetical protein EOP59_00785 [Sphingomonadales bacterium]
MLQLVAVVATGAALALSPPAQGRMLLVPLWPGAEQGMIARATRHNALLLGRGPLPRSFVVSGSRTSVSAGMLGRGVLVIAAPLAGCGAEA